MDLTKYNEVKAKYKTLLEKSWNDYWDLKNEKDKELVKTFDLTGKYITYSKFNDEYIEYLYVDEQFECHDISGENALMLRGSGFTYQFTAYKDDTYVRYDQFYAIEIKLDKLEEQIENIKEITKEEYESAFYKMIDNLKIEFPTYFETNTCSN